MRKKRDVGGLEEEERSSPEVPATSLGPVFHPEPFCDGPGVRRGPLGAEDGRKPPVVIFAHGARSSDRTLPFCRTWRAGGASEGRRRAKGGRGRGKAS